MLTVNLGTGTPEEARDWVEYCNAPTGSKFADLRAAHGHPDPWNVKLWCLGNEMDGHWQIGHVPARDYAIRAQQAAKMMKDIDPTLELVACGSCGITLPTYMQWDREVLEYLGDYADYISLHRYVGNRKNNTLDYLAVSNSIDRQIEDMDAACRFIQAQRHSQTRPYLCFDEWNVWYKNHEKDGAGKFAPHLLEEIYNLEDALVVSSFFHSFLRHADVVKIANLAQIVNVIAPVLTDGDELLIQSIFHPFRMFSARRNGVSLHTALTGPAYYAPSYGRTPYLDTSAILDNHQLHVFLTNRSPEESAPVSLRLADKSFSNLADAELLTGPHPKAANSFSDPNLIQPQPFTEITLAGNKASLELPPLSFTALTINLQ
jgi:alpha-N-arabinofuranosidase